MRFIFPLLLLICFQFAAQVEAPYIQNFTNKVYGKNSNPEIYSVVQDNQDVILAGTSNGVLIYNGKSWKFCGVKAGAHVLSMSKDKYGNIFIGTLGDLGVLKRNSKGSYFYKSLLKGETINEAVWRVFTIEDETFFQTESCIYIYSLGKKLRKIKAETSFHLSFESANHFYVRQRKKGLFVYQNKQLKLVDKSKQIKEDGLFALFHTKNSNRYFFRNDFGSTPIESSIYGGIALKDGNYAINTLTNGVYILNSKFEVLYNYNQSNGLKDNDIKQIYQGSDGNLWLATNNGLSYIEYQSDLSYFDGQKGLDGDIQDIAFYGKTYVASSKGIFVINGQQVEKLKFAAPVWQFFSDSKHLYAATSVGIIELIGNQIILKKQGVYNNIISFQNMLVITGMNGITLCSPTFQELQHYDIPLNRTLGIVEDRQRSELWIGTIGAGLYRLKKDHSLEMYDNQIDGLNISWIRPIQNEKKELLFATKDGLQRFIFEEEVQKTLPDSLKSDPMYSRGLFELVGGNQEVFEFFQFRQKSMALVSNEIRLVEKGSYKKSSYSYADFGRINNVETDNKGNLFLCTSEGLVKINKSFQESKSYLKLSLVSLKSKNKTLSFKEEITIPYYRNKIEFHLQTPDYLHGHSISYRYKLSGEQEEWSELKQLSHLDFEKLFEGSYDLFIQAENSIGEKSNILHIQFTISTPWYRTIYAYIFYIIVLSLSYYFTIKYSRQRLQRKNDELEQIVRERTHEIELQKEEIEEKHKEITDSINYAERIQTALMMSDEHWNAFAKEYFIFFKPRDIVSGDFYWAYHNDDYAVWAAADCTGHGVPGAFMSMLGIGFLNEIVIEGKHFYPSDVLNLLREKIIKALEQKGSNEERKDGMDITLCVWDKRKHEVLFSGANNPLFVLTSNAEKAVSFADEKMIQHNGRFLLTIPADKMPVGKFVQDNQSFTTKTISLDEGDYFFSLSDGFQDQFGGVDGKKYMIKRLKQFFLMQKVEDLGEFSSLLEKEFLAWLREGMTEQVDDVCVLGVKLC